RRRWAPRGRGPHLSRPWRTGRCATPRVGLPPRHPRRTCSRCGLPAGNTARTGPEDRWEGSSGPAAPGVDRIEPGYHVARDIGWVESRGQLREVGISTWLLPRAGGQRPGHQAVELMFAAEEVAQLVLQNGEQVHPALIAGEGGLAVVARRRIDPAPAGGIGVEPEDVAEGETRGDVAELGDVPVDAVPGGGVRPADEQGCEQLGGRCIVLVVQLRARGPVQVVAAGAA